MPTRLLCYCPVSAMSVRMHRYWIAAVRRRTLAVIDRRECFVWQEKVCIAVQWSCIHFREKVLFLLLQLLLMDMLVILWKHDNLECRPLNSTIACSPVACSPVVCSPVACSPLACSPTGCSPIVCSTVACSPVACSSVACCPVRSRIPTGSVIAFQNPQGSFLDFKEPSLLGCFAGIIS